jgi:nickel-dependent lactate racemase
MASGIPLTRISILVATGLHRANEGKELEELVGDPWVMATVSVANHFADNDADHVDLGATATRGTPVTIDRRFLEADLRIATGLIEPHFMAGWSGGRKVVAPGVAGWRTIRTFHPGSWKIPWPCSATWSATRCTRSSWKSSAGSATSMRSTRWSTRNATWCS